MNQKNILFVSLFLLLNLAKSFSNGYLPPVVKENFLSVSIEKEQQIISSPNNVSGKISHYFQAHINLNFNSTSNSHLSKGLQTIMKEIVELIYPPLLLIHEHDFVLHVSKFHPSKLLSRIPLRVNVIVSIA